MSKANINFEFNARFCRAFTLIELLVVISIIGVLAGLTLGLAGLATRKSAESRVKGEMAKVVNAIEGYKAATGSYPPDHRDPTQQFSIPAPNQLYYELSGTVYKEITGSQGEGRFYVVGRQDYVSANDIKTSFGMMGFANAARDPKELKYKEDFRASQVKRVVNPMASKDAKQIDVLAVPVKGPSSWTLRGAGINTNEVVNPWLYISTSPTNNPERFDLWTEVTIRGKTVRFSNWEKDPVVLTP
jgi:prepilin-type N-terminal cleavage/methylation domain-containing protein